MIKGIAAGIVMLGLLGLVGNMDYQDEKAEYDLYVELVCEHGKPDYKNLKPECE